MTFTTRLDTCPPVHINDAQILQENHVKYLGLHLDHRLTWHTHIFSKHKQLGLSLTKMYWLLGRKSKLSFNNKFLIYKVILKPIWTYGIQLWGTTSNSNIEILERFQPNVLRLIVDAPWYISNSVICNDLLASPTSGGCSVGIICSRTQTMEFSFFSFSNDLQIPTVKEEISRFNSHYNVRVSVHPNELIASLTDPPIQRRLRRYWPHDLLVRF
jgi:hypothetical protein